MTDLCDDDGAEASCEQALKAGHDADAACVDVLVRPTLRPLFFCNILRRCKVHPCASFSSAVQRPLLCCKPQYTISCLIFRTTPLARLTSKYVPPLPHCFFVTICACICCRTRRCSAASCSPTKATTGETKFEQPSCFSPTPPAKLSWCWTGAATCLCCRGRS